MNQERLIELLVELHSGLRRQGPGNRASTLRALALCAGLPERPAILDVGCGAGAQTLDLADATGGTILAADLFPAFLDPLRNTVRRRGLGHRVHVLEADMNALPFPEASFDLVWSEGAVYIMGFDNGLSRWRPLIRPRGWLAVTEVSWLVDDVPADLREHWLGEYPGMRTVRENLAAARGLGYEVAGHFALPEEAWTKDYYGPLKPRLAALAAAHPGDEDARAVAATTAREMDLFARHSHHYNYVFYVLRRTD